MKQETPFWWIQLNVSYMPFNSTKLILIEIIFSTILFSAFYFQNTIEWNARTHCYKINKSLCASPLECCEQNVYCPPRNEWQINTIRWTTKTILNYKGILTPREIWFVDVFYCLFRFIWKNCTINIIKSNAIKLPEKNWKEHGKYIRTSERKREREISRFQLKFISRLRIVFFFFCISSMVFTLFLSFSPSQLFPLFHRFCSTYFILNGHMCQSKCVYLGTHVRSYIYTDCNQIDMK